LAKFKGCPQPPVNISVKVHVLAGELPDKVVSLEIVATSLASYQMLLVAISLSEAKKLVALLQLAISR
jgi:hypothetical protein